MQFVLLHHTGWPGHPDHFDLMLQIAPGADDDARVLETYSTLTGTQPDGLTPLHLQKIQAHRRYYLNHEGPVEGPPEARVGRGQVLRVDQGELRELPLSNQKLRRFEMSGLIFKGKYQIHLCENGRAVLSKF